MDKFTASNGLTVDGTTGRIIVRDRTVFPKYDLGKYTVEALREFFQAERDEELGRWRYPADPRYIVYPPDADDEARAIIILFEPGGGSSKVTREWLDNVVDPEKWAYAACAKAYFEAHPVREPWHDAKIGEIWDLIIDGQRVRAIACYSHSDSVGFQTDTRSYFGIHGSAITGGERVLAARDSVEDAS